MLRVIAISVLLVGLTPEVTRSAPWHRPVSGRIVGTFSFAPAAPYAAGQRRGIVIAAEPGAPVRAACGGHVAFAGTVGRAGPTLSVRCGALRATYQGIAAVGPRAGDRVGRGEPVAVVGRAGELHLGARAGPAAYVDPATLFADPAPPLGPAPSPAVRRPTLRPRPAPIAPAAPSRPRPAPAIPLLAWFGLALVAVAFPAGGLARRSRRRGEPSHAPAAALAAS